MSTHTCPCCSHPLLRHIRAHRISWYCCHCHQYMPNLQLELELNNITSLDVNISRRLPGLPVTQTAKVERRAVKETA